jgi:hypothetical protein
MAALSAHLSFAVVPGSAGQRDLPMGGRWQ